MNYHAVYQNGCTIFGVGKTEADAVSDYNDNTPSTPIKLETLKRWTSGKLAYGDMMIIEITERLYDQVIKNGGDQPIEYIGTGLYDLEVKKEGQFSLVLVDSDDMYLYEITGEYRWTSGDGSDVEVYYRHPNTGDLVASARQTSTGWSYQDPVDNNVRNLFVDYLDNYDILDYLLFQPDTIQLIKFVINQLS